MRVSYLWLKALLPEGALDDLPPAELARRLTLLGMAVDEVRPGFASFEGVVLGKVVESGPHPNADKLSLCAVTAGDGEVHRVVCGAPNVEEGALYGFATVGSRLPGDRTIGRAKIRGVESEGMLCSAPELGLDALGSAEGIWRIPGAAEEDLGRDLREVLGLDDTILDVDVTSNRGDALSHLGMAREVGAIAGAAPRLPDVELAEAGAPAGEPVGIEIRDADGCPRYYARVIDGLEIAPSPGWMQTRLLALGMRPVNGVVDATNWVMLETGQPLHPFDLARVRGGRIVVRRAGAGERFVTLDGRERTLDPEMTMICDAEGPVAIGGVMGGLESEVGHATTAVLLEGAWFDPKRIGRTARRLGLVSEASTRFARGVDPAALETALDRAAAWIARLSGGRLAPGRAGVEAVERGRRPRIELRLARLETLVGRPFSAAEASKALTALGFAVEAGDAAIVAEVPSWRFDVAREVDLVEEVARVAGYDTVPESTLPAPAVAPAPEAEDVGLERLSSAARAAGFDEARTASFVAEDVLGEATPVDNLVEIRNPISKAERFLRPYVLTTLGAAVAHNVARGASRVKLFEIGHAFALEEGGAGVDERRRLALAASGERRPLHWSTTEERTYDFFDLKGDLEDVVAAAGGWRPGFVPGDRPWLHPGRQAEILGPEGGASVGFCGEVHPRVAGAWGIDGRLFVAEIDTAPFERRPGPAAFRPFAREPASERDLALVVPDEVRAADAVATIEALDPEHVARIAVFDRYRGAQLPEGRYSLGIRLTFQADRTLTDEEVDREVGRVIDTLERERGWTLR